MSLATSIVLSLPFALAAPAGDGDPVLLLPKSFVVPLDSTTPVYYVQGTARDQRGSAFMAFPIESHFSLGQGFQRNGDELLPDEEGGDSFSWTFDRPGLCRLEVVSRAPARPVGASLLRTALVEGGNDHDERPVPQITGSADRSVSPILSAATLVEVGEALGTAALRKVGRPVEIRLLASPVTLAETDDLPVRVYVEGAPLTSALVRARRIDGAVRCAVSDSLGCAVLRIDAGGLWWIEFQHVRSGAKPTDPLEWYRATLSFRVPEKEAAWPGGIESPRTDDSSRVGDGVVRRRAPSR